MLGLSVWAAFEFPHVPPECLRFETCGHSRQPGCGLCYTRSSSTGACLGDTTAWLNRGAAIDATPVPCGASRETVRRSELAGRARYAGYCAAHSRWYWGLKLYLVTTADVPVAWCLAAPKLGERHIPAGLLAHAACTGALRPGLILIGDEGFAVREFEDLVTTGFGMSLVRPDRRDETPATDRSAGSGRGSNRSTTPSKASSTSNATAFAPPNGSTSVLPGGYWSWPSASGTTGQVALRSGAR
jgi:hypothetical protein